MLRTPARFYDTNYYPRITPIMISAQKKGARVLSGIGMLISQAALSFSIWTNEKAPFHLMQEEIFKKNLL